MDVRADLSTLLQSELKEEKQRLQQKSEASSEFTDGVEPAMEFALSEWLGDCVDEDTKTKVCCAYT